MVRKVGGVVLNVNEILFVGLNTSAVGWYRCYLPAINLGSDWVGVVGEPPKLHVTTGLVGGDTVLPRFDDYKVVVIQQPKGRKWLDQINSLRSRGVKVLYEVDDYLHGVRKQAHHDYAKHFGKKDLRELELCMRVCDGIVCSTEYIGRRYAKFNRNVYVCENGLDIARYHLTRPERSTVNIGWAGATGHMQALMQWLNTVLDVMKERPDTCFVAIGQPGLAQPFQQVLGDESRAIGIPFTMMESYPAAMTMIDIALAPAGKSGWYQGKSDLRWLEAGALGIPIIADPGVYPKIEHGVNGFHADSAAEMGAILGDLIDDADKRQAVGQAAKRYVYNERSISDLCLQWYEVASAVVGGYESAHEIARR